MAEFKDRLSEAMKLKKINQTRLTEQANLAGGAVSNYLKGRYKPSSDSMLRIAEVLGVDVAWLSGDERAIPTRVKRVKDVQVLGTSFEFDEDPVGNELVELLITKEERYLISSYRVASKHEQEIVQLTLNLRRIGKSTILPSDWREQFNEE